MTAADKLRTLDEAMPGVGWHRHPTRPGMLRMPSGAYGEFFATAFPRGFDSDALAVLRNALPEIIAVVEAAEEVEACDRAGHDSFVAAEMGFTVRKALTALEKKLQ